MRDRADLRSRRARSASRRRSSEASRGPGQDLITPLDWSHRRAADRRDATASPPAAPARPGHQRPVRPTGVSDTPSRGADLRCRPASRREERPAREEIVDRLAPQAFRRPLTASESRALMALYEQGAPNGGFEDGIRTALQAILASPHFVFRLEEPPDGTRAGREPTPITRRRPRGSRLSFFLWGAAAGRRAARRVAPGAAVRPRRCSSARRAGCSRTRAPRRSRRASRAQWLRLAGPREDPPRRADLPVLRRAARGRDASRDRAVLRPPRAGGPERARAAHGRLHVRERAAGAALRHPGRDRRRVPQGARTRTTTAAASSATAAC